eukprot:scaffold82023_cov57-Phaeocystis_antarctica.AAC.2
MLGLPPPRTARAPSKLPPPPPWPPPPPPLAPPPPPALSSSACRLEPPPCDPADPHQTERALEALWAWSYRQMLRPARAAGASAPFGRY